MVSRELRTILSEKTVRIKYIFKQATQSYYTTPLFPPANTPLLHPTSQRYVKSIHRCVLKVTCASKPIFFGGKSPNPLAPGFIFTWESMNSPKYIQGFPKKRNDSFLTINWSNMNGFWKFLILAAQVCTVNSLTAIFIWTKSELKKLHSFWTKSFSWIFFQCQF